MSKLKLEKIQVIFNLLTWMTTKVNLKTEIFI